MELCICLNEKRQRCSGVSSGSTHLTSGLLTAAVKVGDIAGAHRSTDSIALQIRCKVTHTHRDMLLSWLSVGLGTLLR